jgi:glucose/arabinose dehydrogenase
MKPPVLHSGPSYTWAPSGAAYLDGRVFFAGLRGEALYEARIRGSRVAELRAHFQGEFGRIRAVRVGPDGFLYFSTSNRDGRGRRRSGDDKIVRVNPAVFR